MKTNQTKPFRTPMFRVRCWMLNVAVLAAAGSALAEVHYVDVNGTNATPPYSDWATAATNIQDAVNAAVAGDEVVVTNGLYATGGRSGNRVEVNKPLAVRSVNGPQFTTINGGRGIRCAYLTNAASLSGFTLKNGRTYEGGGVWCESSSAVVSNCVITGNFVDTLNPGAVMGGGAYGGTLNNCTLSGNSATVDYQYPCGQGDAEADGGGAAYCTMNNCTLSLNSANATNKNCNLESALAQGGGAFKCTLRNCILVGNWVSVVTPGAVYQVAGGYGCGACYCALDNCTLSGNSGIELGNYANIYGGGACYCGLNNCTLTGNRANNGGGAYFSFLNNCILLDGSPFSTLNYCWTTDPLFVAGSLRLQSNSPCINAGSNFFATNATDLDGNPRIAGGTVDIGAYEFQTPASRISYAWLQQYGLPINANTDAADPDGDGLNNWQEWRCQTDPTSALSVLRLLAPANDGTNMIVTWQSVAGVNYFLERSASLAAAGAFSSIATNLPGQPGTTSYADTNAVGSGPFFYRVGVSNP